MPDSRSFSCFLIGADTLLNQCGEHLLDSGHRVEGVVTSAARVRDWAAAKGIRVIPADGDYAALLAAEQFDYLFAITHLAIIPDRAVASPRRMAINFHDGPLPAYAGLNTPLWALMNGETGYAITWHVMATGVDKGDILLQAPVAIGPEDTGLSINTKCFAAAIESFPVLVRSLVEGTVQRRVQDLGARSYFSRLRKPPLGGLIDWQAPAEVAERLVRALNVGRYANPLASAKLLLGDVALIVDAARAGVADGTGAPGEIVSLDADALCVRCGDGVLEISALHDLSGAPVAIAELAARHGLAPGRQLPVPDAAARERLEAIVQRCAREESFWEARLAGLRALELPHRTTGACPRGSARASRRLVLPGALAAGFPGVTAQHANAAALALMLGRSAAALEFDLPLYDRARHADCAGFAALVSDMALLGVELDAARPALAQARELAAGIGAALGRGPWLRDLVARAPALRAASALAADAVAPLALALGEAPAVAELVVVVGEDGGVLLEYATTCYTDASIERLAQQLEALAAALVADAERGFAALDPLPDQERRQLLEDWNRTSLEHDRSLTVQRAFEQQVARTPEAVAIACEGREISYRELGARAARVAARLKALGVGPDVLVGVHVSRSIELMVATLGVLKAGGAYVPLDPAFPADRIAYMIEDSAMPVILSQASLRAELPPARATVLDVADAQAGAAPAATGAESGPANLAYMIYTSGSTGRPKGVMIEHRNVINFFAAMDQRVPRDGTRQPVWMAVTSLSFDISVLELFWTLARGFKVVIHDEAKRASADASVPGRLSRSLRFGLFMWGNDDAPGPAKYRLLLEGSKYFDQNGFHAVWTPERHFHAFGGPYPNPSVTGAAVAAVTSNLVIRAGSCVMPLHHPVRIAEEWAVVDNLCNGRVELAAASGWNPNDFVFHPDNYANFKQVMFSHVDEVRRLWRGEKVAFKGGLGNMVEIQSLPRPVSKELPLWITTAGNPDTYRDAGARGFNVLTHLLGQTVEEVAGKIRIYREARAAAGFDPAAGRVALMLHTFVGEDNDAVRELVRAPMKSYLASSMKLTIDFAWAFPAFKRPGGAASSPDQVDIKKLSPEDVETILDFAFDRYFETSGLFGCVETCLAMLRRCCDAGVDEIACLLDFGVETAAIMDSLPRLKQLKDRASELSAPAVFAADDYSFAAQVQAHGVTHLQCTPSMARMYCTAPEARAALGTIANVLVGGEALPLTLARELKALLPGTLTNMYGPTETTIWSMTHSIDDVGESIPIGTPIANTRVYLLDRFRRPVPVGFPGELFIGGEGVARGYHNRPELSAERFVPDPFGPSSGDRMYATGDLARYRPDGVMDFLGRTDFQVKVRGYRIELGEIESVLEGHAAVQEAAVVVRAEDAADQRLVAFVVPRPGARADAAELRAAARERLPDYMVPNEFNLLADMPRTANGKLDRKALQALRPAPSREAVEDVPPGSDLERVIAGLWQKTLKLERVGVNENFFDLGGHSLLVVQLHGYLKASVPMPVSLTDLYQYPTIRSLAEYLGSGADSTALARGASRGEKRRALRNRGRA